MVTVTELSTNPKFQFEDLRILIIETDSNNQVVAFIGKYNDPMNFRGQGLEDANNLWRSKDCPSVSERTPSKRPEGYFVAGTTNIDNIGYTLMISRERLDIQNEPSFKEKVKPYGF